VKDINELLAAAQSAAENVQKQMDEAQATLDKIEVEGVSGGGLVKIKATAKGRILTVSIDDSLIARLRSRCSRIWLRRRSTMRARRRTLPRLRRWRR
jgi:YbaB/EbfC DNA-binding family